MTSADPLTWTFVIVVVSATCLALIAVRGAAALPWRLAALGVYAGLVISSYGGLTELMSRAKPVALEWARLNVDSVKVAASHMRENEAIFLWLIFDGETEPRAYRLPWDSRMAREIRKAQRQAERMRSDVRMERPFKSRRTEEEIEQTFHTPPRPAPPRKSANAS